MESLGSFPIVVVPVVHRTMSPFSPLVCELGDLPLQCIGRPSGDPYRSSSLVELRGGQCGGSGGDM